MQLYKDIDHCFVSTLLFFKWLKILGFSLFCFLFYFEWLTLTKSGIYFFLIGARYQPPLLTCCCAPAEVGSHLNCLFPEPSNILNDDALWQIPARKAGNNRQEPKLVPYQSQEKASHKYLLHSFAPHLLLPLPNEICSKMISWLKLWD